MADTEYTKTISSTFSNGIFIPSLADEIQLSSIVPGLRSLDTDGDTLVATFKAELSSGEESIFDGLCSSHLGIVLEDDTLDVKIKDTPTEVDGRLNIVNAPMTHGMYSWWTGSGDIAQEDVPPQAGPMSGRGMGPNWDLFFTVGNGETHTTAVGFNSYVEIYDGEGVWTPQDSWGIEDRFSLYILVTPNHSVCTDAAGAGNANVVDTGMGFSMIVPAAGDGAYNFDTDKGSPLMVGDGNPMAYWYMESCLEDTIAPAVGGVGQATGNTAFLYDMGWRIYVCKNMPMGSPRGVFLVDSDKSEPIHKNWQMVISATKNTPGQGQFGVWLKFFRPDTSEPDYPPTVAC